MLIALILEIHSSPFLKHDVRIGFDVRHVYGFSIFDDFRMFSNAQPKNMREPEASISVVRISVGVRIFVVLSMVSDPLPETVLTTESEQEEENEL
jgi:hypothetical protein